MEAFSSLVALKGEDGTQVVADETVYKDGVYEGTGTGRNREIKVAVTVKDGKISSVEVISHNESSDIGGPALPTG